MGYKTSVEVDIQEVFDSLRKNEQVEFLRENVTALLDDDEIWELLSADGQQRMVENCAKDFGFIEANSVPKE